MDLEEIDRLLRAVAVLGSEIDGDEMDPVETVLGRVLI
jgi:hypothetical protein